MKIKKHQMFIIYIYVQKDNQKDKNNEKKTYIFQH